MLGRGRDPRSRPVLPAHLAAVRPQPKAPLARPEPDYEVVEFPSDQYVNAKLQPPPPPPRPPAGHPEAVLPCGLCGGGGARVRCAECDKRPLCASCDEMYHRHPKRRNHHRQVLPLNQLSDVRPPLPPKVVAPPVPPPRRHKIGGERMSASPKPPTIIENRRATVGSVAFGPPHMQTSTLLSRPHVAHPALAKSPQPKMPPSYMGSMPYLPTHNASHGLQQSPQPMMAQTATWGRPRTTYPAYLQPNQQPPEMWESPDHTAHQQWARPMRRGASVLDLNQSMGGHPMGAGCGGCGQCAGGTWRYGSCQSLENSWGAWPPPAPCCLPPHPAHRPHPHSHAHMHSHTPQPYRRASSRAGSRAASRAASPAASTRSHRSRRPPRSPSPRASSDADSESEGDQYRPQHASVPPGPPDQEEDCLAAPPPPPPNCSWQCEHCTFVNEPGVRVCAVCCKTPTTAPKVIAEVTANVTKLNISEKPRAPSVALEQRKAPLNGAEIKPQTQAKKERISTGCGPSPPREEKKPAAQSMTPPRDVNSNQARERHDMGVGPSPPKEVRQTTPAKETVRSSPITKHSISVGPSPPRENLSRSSFETSSMSTDKRSTGTGTSPLRTEIERRPSSRASVANTGTSPPPQSISTQTYEVPQSYEGERDRPPSRSRSRRRFRDDAWRERSHSRHSLSSDTKESSRSGGGGGGGGGASRWRWRDEDAAAAMRRASLLDLRRPAPSTRYQAPSPELLSARAMSLETLSVAGRAERGLQLARLMAEAEALGFSAAELHAALAQDPTAPLAWLKERWPGLVASVREAAARLCAGAAVSAADARAALARHRGAVWPAVTDCLNRAQMGVGEERRLRGRVWGSPAGVEDDAAPAPRADYSSDEFDGPPTNVRDDDWMYLPVSASKPLDVPQYIEPEIYTNSNDGMAYNINTILNNADVPKMDDNLLLQELLAEGNRNQHSNVPQNQLFLGQSENDFIEAYNALTKSTPLPVNKQQESVAKAQKDLNQNIIMNPQRNSGLQLPASSITPHNIATPSSHSSDANVSNHTRRTNQLNNESTLNRENKNKAFTSKNQVHVRKLNQTRHRDTSDSEAEYYSQRRLSNPKKNKNSEQVPTNGNITQPSNSNQSWQNDDKSNNLSDMVDDTQRLIQQMKDEIHSDITSLDEPNMARSEESNNSSQTDLSTEHESSYSESIEDSDVESGEGELEESVNIEVQNTPAQNNIDKLNRTSSEDNEQFEEAMDHIEPIDAFEQTNIHILDSIARSLQEDQTISVENKAHVTPVASIQAQVRRQDYNNNVFSSVNSFEEIYEGLSSEPASLIQIPKPNVEKSESPSKGDASQMQVPTIKKVVYVKEPINIMQFHSDPVSQVLILEYKEPIYKAIIEHMEKPIPVPISTPEAKEEKPLPEKSNDTRDDHTIVNLVIEDPDISNASLFLPESQTDFHDINNQEIAYIDNVSDADIQNEDVSDPRVNEASEQIDQKQVTKKAPNSPSSDSSNKKSNIPKLIRVLQNTKNKLDRNFPRVIASKVPVRRPSLKSHQAPAPPKNHFGNIQSGQVKQLQSRLFNNKVFKPPTKVVIPEPKPTTSSGNTLNKKKQAPQPPTASAVNNDKQPSPSKVSPAKEGEKKSFFRETCRTEDEWSDSDSDGSQVFKREDRSEEPERPRSPPPPLTLRRVSGNIIDLATIRLPEGSPERQARMLLAEGATETWEQAELAVDLVGRGTELATALLAALECTDLDGALAYLNQECELCASRLAEHEMVSMLRCTHRCCRECARHYFTVQITERSIIDCVCPYCKEPELENLSEDAWLEYFAHLDILLKTLIETEVHELFQRKLRDRTLARDPNFRWCVECSSGFFVHPKQKKVRCPECRSVSCASCRKPWSVNHEDLSCDEYNKWLEDNDPERSIAAVHQHLKENGLDCPRCHFKYSLSRGGCMHFTCTQCKFEFCFGCGKPFTMGARCGVSEYCAKLGLHAHHPRNCLFYLRDKEPHELQTLLQMNNIPFETEAAESGARCGVWLQRETPGGLADAPCGAAVPPRHKGLCKLHYVEYLAGLARGVDPLPIMDVTEVVAELRRRGLPLPERGPWDTDPIYAGMCAEIVKEKIPLE